MDNQMSIGVVHIVEWLNAGDAPTGESLFNQLQPIGAASGPRVAVDFHRIETRDELIALLRRFENAYQDSRRTPILHIETHGDTNGIGTGAGIDWPELTEELIPLNRLTGLNLVVVMAACEGFYGVQMLQPDRRAAAFRGLIGPNRTVTENEVEDACLAFYRTIFDARNGDAAYKAMNDAIDPNAETFWLISAEDVFKIVNRSHFEEHCTPEALARRRDRLVSRVARKHRARTGLDASQQLAQQWFDQATTHLLDQRALFDRLRREYFFINQFPKNEARFDVTFEQCWPAGMELRIG
jgi:hypothetical protein